MKSRGKKILISPFYLGCLEYPFKIFNISPSAASRIMLLHFYSCHAHIVCGVYEVDVLLDMIFIPDLQWIF